jgi:hypothetical protein
LNIPSGLRPAEPTVPAIHPTTKLVGILAKGIKPIVDFSIKDALFRLEVRLFHRIAHCQRSI